MKNIINKWILLNYWYRWREMSDDNGRNESGNGSYRVWNALERNDSINLNDIIINK